jgi:hypothetical protein
MKIFKIAILKEDQEHAKIVAAAGIKFMLAYASLLEYGARRVYPN